MTVGILNEWSLTVTALLQRALQEIEKRSDAEQDAIAALILEELADEARWEQAFAKSPEKLAALAQQAREDIRAGRVQQFGGRSSR